MTTGNYRRLALAVVVVGTLLRVVPTVAQNESFTVMDLGTLGGSRSSAYGINASGQIVGVSTTANGSTRGFIYDNGSLVEVGTFGGRDSLAYAISDFGTVTGRAQNALGDFRAFVTSPTTGLIDLTGLDSAFAAPFSTGTGVNARGDVVGYRQQATEHQAARTRAFLFSNASVTDLGTFGGEDAVLTAVNDQGTFVGFYSTESHADYASHRAFQVQQGGDAQDLGTLGGTLTTPVAINNRGLVAGFAQRRSGESEAFVYQGGRLTALGMLPGGRQSFAYGINEPGDIVGASEAGDGSLHATLYRGGRIIDLNAAIPSTSGWRLIEARDINEAGVIVGTGIIGGSQRGFRLTPARGQ
jgi:probable HAF family extracellular repeat protein